MGLEVIRLHLVSPLYYLREEVIDWRSTHQGNNQGIDRGSINRSDIINIIDPFSYREEQGEMIFHFELDPDQSRSIEPDEGALLSALLSGGRAVGSEEAKDAGRALVLPAGSYLFSQVREILSPEDIVGLAAEVQKEGLWQRLRPGNELYLRYLFEDRRGVTQVFRPYTVL
jgi:hypothetical protein